MNSTRNVSASGSDPFDRALESAARLLSTDPAAALERATALSAESSDPRAFRLMADSYRALRRDDEAVGAEISAIRFGLAPLLNQAMAEQQAGYSAQAKALAEEFLRAHPRDLLARTIAAEASMSMGRFADGEALLQEVVGRAPAFPRGSVLLARCLAAQLRMSDASAVIQQLLKWAPNDSAALHYLADLRAQVGDYASACQLYERVLDAGPDHPDALLKYAQNLRVSGRKPESVKALRRVAEIPRDQGAAYWTLAYYFPDELNDGDQARIQSALAGNSLSSAQEGLLKVALSIIHDRRGEHEEAFRLLSAVKQSRMGEQDYSGDTLSAQVNRQIAEFTPELYASRKSDGAPDASPIFIVGMPRSGSTLMERILGCHSKIEAAGELQVMPHLASALEEHRRARGGRSAATLPLPSDLQRMASWYVERSRDFRRTQKAHFVDKYNANWLYVGLIRLLLPNARIIDVRRNALDCCWSIYKTLGDAYANDQRHLARYFRDYVRLMSAIDTASPGGILTVRYEELVADVEAQTRRVLDFIGLDYERACVDFHLSDAPVATPSSEQVRRPINKSSIGSAEPYRQWLGPLIDELGPLADA